MDRLCAVVATDHALARKRSMTLRELAKHPLILMVKDSSSRQIVDLAFNREGLVSNVAYETTYGTTVAGIGPGGAGRRHPARVDGGADPPASAAHPRRGTDAPHQRHHARRPVAVTHRRHVQADSGARWQRRCIDRGGRFRCFLPRFRACFSSFWRELRFPAASWRKVSSRLAWPSASSWSSRSSPWSFF